MRNTRLVFKVQHLRFLCYFSCSLHETSKSIFLSAYIHEITKPICVRDNLHETSKPIFWICHHFSSTKDPDRATQINPFGLVYYKRDIGKQFRPRSDAAECGVICGVWSGSTLFALNTGICIKHSKACNKKPTIHLFYWKKICPKS